MLKCGEAEAPLQVDFVLSREQVLSSSLYDLSDTTQHPAKPVKHCDARSNAVLTNQQYGVFRFGSSFMADEFGDHADELLCGVSIGKYNWTEPHVRFIRFATNNMLIMPLPYFYDHVVHLVLHSDPFSKIVRSRGLSITDVVKRHAYLEDALQDDDPHGLPLNAILQTDDYVSDYTSLSCSAGATKRPRTFSKREWHGDPREDPMRGVHWDAPGELYQYQSQDIVYHMLLAQDNPGMPEHPLITKLRKDPKKYAVRRRYMRKHRICASTGRLQRYIPRLAVYKTVPRRRSIHSIIRRAHSLADHNGYMYTYYHVNNEYYIRDLSRFVKQFLLRCPQCVLLRKQFAMRRPGAFYSTRPLERIQADLTHVGKLGLNTSKFSMILTVADHFSGYVWARPVENKSAAVVSHALADILHEAKRLTRSEAGSPDMPITFLQTDNGKEFKNELLRKVLENLAKKQVFGQAYTPRHQGLVENSNKRVKDRLHHVLGTYIGLLVHPRWDIALPYVTALINTRVKRQCLLPHADDEVDEKLSLPVTPHLLLRRCGAHMAASLELDRGLYDERLQARQIKARAQYERLLQDYTDTADAPRPTVFGLPERILDNDPRHVLTPTQYRLLLASERAVQQQKAVANALKVWKKLSRKTARMTRVRHEATKVFPGSIVIVNMPIKARKQVQRSYKEWMPTYTGVGIAKGVSEHYAFIKPMARNIGDKMLADLAKKGPYKGCARVGLEFVTRVNVPTDAPPSELLSCTAEEEANLRELYNFPDRKNPFVVQLCRILHDDTEEEGAVSSTPRATRASILAAGAAHSIIKASDSTKTPTSHMSVSDARTPTLRPSTVRSVSVRLSRSTGRKPNKHRVAYQSEQLQQLGMKRKAPQAKRRGSKARRVINVSDDDEDASSTVVRARPRRQRVSLPMASRGQHAAATWEGHDKPSKQLLRECEPGDVSNTFGFIWSDNQCVLDSYVMCLWAAMNTHGRDSFLKPNKFPDGPLRTLLEMAESLFGATEDTIDALSGSKTILYKEMLEAGQIHGRPAFGEFISSSNIYLSLNCVRKDAAPEQLQHLYNTALVDGYVDVVKICSNPDHAHVAKAGTAFDFSDYVRHSYSAFPRERFPYCGHNWLGNRSCRLMVEKHTSRLHRRDYDKKGGRLQPLPHDMDYAVVGVEDAIYASATVGKVDVCRTCKGPAQKVYMSSSRLPPPLLTVGLDGTGGRDMDTRKHGGTMLVLPLKPMMDMPGRVQYKLAGIVFIRRGHAVAQVCVPGKGWFYYDGMQHRGRLQYLCSMDKGPVYTRTLLPPQHADCAVYIRDLVEGEAAGMAPAAYVPPWDTVDLTGLTRAEPKSTSMRAEE